MELSKYKKNRLRRPLILASLIVGMFLSAIEATIVATAMPSIVADLGGFFLYSWVFSAYLLTMATTVLIFGKLADLYGRKPIYIIGISIFLVGSTLCGLSTSMTMLIIARFIQGIGAGALMPIATTIVGDIYNREERAKIQGYLSSVWGISAVTGPLLGGFFVDILNWRYVFWMNIPLGLLAVLGIIIFFHEDMKQRKQAIDYFGSFLFVLAIGTLMFILVEGGVGIEWMSLKMTGLIGVFLAAIILFFIQERKTNSPLLPLEIWRYPLISIANITSLTVGMIMIGVSSYLPAFVQGVMGESATVAGFTLTSMSIGWPLASTTAGRLLLRIGYRNTSLIGGISLIFGTFLFFMLTPDKGPLWAGIGSFFVGVGLGMSTTSFIVGIQSSVNWEVRGIATASNMFMRSLGSAIGAAFLGGLLNNHINSFIHRERLEQTVSVDTVNQLLDPNHISSLPKDIAGVLQSGLTSGLHIVYTGIFVLAIISLVLIYFMPKEE